MHRFYAPPNDIKEGRIVLEREETRHLRDVLRMRKGDIVRVFDGLGTEYECRVADAAGKRAVLSIAAEVEPRSPESKLDLTLAAALLKGEKFDLVVQKAVELGVKRLVPLVTARCDIKIKNAEKRLGRWRKISLEAAKQSGRAALMAIDEPADLEKFLSASDPKGMTRLFFSERSGGRLTEKVSTPGWTAVVGPEGGWDDAELQAAGDAGFAVVTLGGRILRAETAAIAVTAILQHRFGDLN